MILSQCSCFPLEFSHYPKHLHLQAHHYLPPSHKPPLTLNEMLLGMFQFQRHQCCFILYTKPFGCLCCFKVVCDRPMRWYSALTSFLDISIPTSNFVYNQNFSDLYWCSSTKMHTTALHFKQQEIREICVTQNQSRYDAQNLQNQIRLSDRSVQRRNHDALSMQNMIRTAMLDTMSVKISPPPVR